MTHQSRPLAGALTVTVIFALVLLLVSVIIINGAEERIIYKQADLVESSIRSACVNAYAVSGRYPTLEEIERDYNVNIDRNAFTVNYSAFASNVMPYINVIIKE